MAPVHASAAFYPPSPSMQSSNSIFLSSTRIFQSTTSKLQSSTSTSITPYVPQHHIFLYHILQHVSVLQLHLFSIQQLQPHNKIQLCKNHIHWQTTQQLYYYVVSKVFMQDIHYEIQCHLLDYAYVHTCYPVLLHNCDLVIRTLQLERSKQTTHM